MATIFLDESGDLGFNFTKKKTSKFFVITCLFIESKRPIEKVVKKTHSELKKKFKRRLGILHAVKEKPLTRQRLLRRLGEKECYIKRVLPIKGSGELIASKRETNKFLNENFKNYLNTQIQNKHKMGIKIFIKNPSEHKALQIVEENSVFP